jgi:hypothetical protein
MKDAYAYLQILLLISLFLISAPLLAAEYRCETDQVYIWEHGKIEPSNDALRNLKFIVFRDLDRQRGSFHHKESEDALEVAGGIFHIIQRPDAHNDLVAIMNPALEGKTYLQQLIFRMRAWDKNTGPIFTYMTDGGPNLFATGRCSIDVTEGWNEPKAGGQK